MNIDFCVGNVYNVGGGIQNTLSLLQLIDIIEYKLNKKCKYDFEDWRPGDQKIYISDTTKIKEHVNWCPRVSPKIGVDMMIDWIKKNKQIFHQLELI